MADNTAKETAITGRDAGESSDATVEIKIKTLDSQLYTFRVNKHMPVPALKEQIATATGVPLEQQRLICRGKVLKDNQLLSDYHVEDGHTLHLVVRQPVPPSTSSPTAGPSGSEGTSEQQGNDNATGAARNRVGQVSHNVVFGTFNLQDQGDGGFPDLNRILATVLNSIGMGSPTPVNVGAANGPTVTMPVLPTHGQQGTGSEGQDRQDNSSGGSQTSNQQQSGLVLSNIVLEPVNQALHMPTATQQTLSPQDLAVPDALATLSLYLNRMEQEFLINRFDNQHHSPTSASSGSQDQANASGISSVSRGLPTPAALGTLIRRAQQLMNGPAGAAFSQLAGELENENMVTEPLLRSRIQSIAMWNGVMMQELGALLLELGRATLTLRMGQSHAESVVNAGPAVYISPSGPNPIMVQPQVFQRAGAFGPFPIGAVQPTTGVTGGSVGTGDVPRNINIHIHAGTSLASGGAPVSSPANAEQGNQTSVPQNTGQADQVQVRNGIPGPRETGSVRVVPVRTVVAAVPPRPPTETSNSAFSAFYPLLARFQQMNPGQGSPIRGIAQAFINAGQSSGQQPSETLPFPPIVAHVQAQIQNVNGGAQSMNSLSAPVVASASENSNSEQEMAQNQSVSTTEQHVVQQGLSDEHLGIDNDVRDRLRNGNSSNVGVSSGSDMANLVNSVLQQVMGAYTQSGRPNQQEPDQQQATACLATRDESNSLTKEPTVSEKSLNDEREVASSENTTDVGPVSSAIEANMKELDMSSLSNNAIASTSYTSSQSELLQPIPEKECSDGHTTVPVGLGLGGLQPLPSKKRTKQNHKQQTNKLAGPDFKGEKNEAVSVDQHSQSSIARGKNVLQALLSQRVSDDHRADENGSSAVLPNGLAEMFGNMVPGGRPGNGRVDVGDIMSQLLRTPTMSNFISGMAEQTGSGPPRALSSMMEQVTRSPALRNTMQQMTEQLAEHGDDLGNMLSGMGGSQDSFDFSKVLQQMMPLVSQVLGGASGGTSSGPSLEAQSRASNAGHAPPTEGGQVTDQNFQIDLEPTIQKLENHDPPQEVFRSMVENTMALYAADADTSNGADTSEILNQLPNTESLASEYIAMLNRDFIRRLQSESGSTENS